MVIGIFPNFAKLTCPVVVKQIVELCRTNHVEYYLPDDLDYSSLDIEPPVEAEHFKARGDILRTADVAMMLGGDGTILNLSKEFAYYDVPICGVNLGSLGFLYEIGPDDLSRRFQDILQGRYFVEDRMMLRSRLFYPDGNVEELPVALNDVVIGHGNIGKMIRVDMYVNGCLIQRYPSDGVIVSTPTGSTGYNLSSSGPIVAPLVHCLLVNPICPHLLQKVPLMFHENDRISFTATHSRNSIRISVDGMTDIEFDPTAMLCVDKSPQTLKFLRFEENYFYQTLFPKLLGNRE